MDLPRIGLGTMGIDDSAVIKRAVDIGYRHLDTAQIYENETIVGAGIAASDVPRDELLVATKVWASNLAPADVVRSTHQSLDRLGIETIDLLYVHRPIETYTPPETLPAFDRLREAGVINHVGVSNFDPDDLDLARNHLDAPIAVNQVEFHPLHRPMAALADAREHGYELLAYSPLAAGKALDLPPIRAIAAAREVSPAAVVLMWLHAKGVKTVPKATSPDHLRANLVARELSLSDAEVGRIDAIDRREELFPD